MGNQTVHVCLSVSLFPISGHSRKRLSLPLQSLAGAGIYLPFVIPAVCGGYPSEKFGQHRFPITHVGIDKDDGFPMKDVGNDEEDGCHPCRPEDTLAQEDEHGGKPESCWFPKLRTP